jgi:putative heme-binding domain-containing protein
MLLRGAYYPSFGKPHDGLGFGPTMIAHNHGSSGIGGIAYYAAAQFPSQYRDTLLIGNPVTGRVNHDRLKTHGSTYECIELDDFVRCDDPWFRPVNLQVGPDGALYIADFYNRIIGHYEVPLEHPGRDRERGRIWRVVYTGRGAEKPEPTAPPFGPNVALASRHRLIELLDDPNLTVRTLATHELVDRGGPDAVEPLQTLLISKASTANQRIHGLWALERLGGLNSTLVERLARDSDRGVRVHVMKMLAERTWDSSPLVLAALDDSDAFVRRAAADALARHPSAHHVQPLLDLWGSTPLDDTHLVHTARMAVRDQLLKPGLYDELAATDGSDAQRLDRLCDVSLGVPNAESAAFVWRQLQTDPARGGREALWHHVARYAPDNLLPQVFLAVTSDAKLNGGNLPALARAMGRAAAERGGKLPQELTAWTNRLAEGLLQADDESQVRTGIELAREMNLGVFDALARAAGPAARFGGLRTTAIDACVAADAARACPLVADTLARASEPIALRQHCAAALARINDEESRAKLVSQLQTAPEPLAVAIAGGLAESAAGGEALLASVAEGKASPRLLQEAPLVSRLKARKLDNLDERLSALTAGLPPQDARLNELINRRRNLFAASQPDLAAGAALFKKNCANCHRIGDEGAKIGPNLDGVGIRGLERLLEDVLDPNRNVDQAFRTTQVVSIDGRIVSGLVLRQEGKVLVLADAQGKEVRVPSDEIDQRVVNQLSPMPANVNELVNEAEFVHLLGYLLSQREKPAQ